MKGLSEIIHHRILLLDGAMGTMIQRHALTEKDFRNNELESHPHSLKGNNDILSITRPDIILNIHRAYLEAGADIIETNTFSSTIIAQADYGLDNKEWVFRMNYESAALAKKAAIEYSNKNIEKPRFVAGALGPTNRTASISPDVNDPAFRAVTFQDLKEAYYTQVDGLVKGGVDLLLVETIFDTLNAKAALFAIDEYKEKNTLDIPVMVSATITDASGRTLSGQTTEAFLISISHMDLFSVGLNCALGADQLKQYVRILSENAPYPISAYPNAGLPNAFGHYDQTPEEMKNLIKEYLEEGIVNIVGGCCGTTPEHIKELANLISNYKPRKVHVETV